MKVTDEMAALAREVYYSKETDNLDIHETMKAALQAVFDSVEKPLGTIPAGTFKKAGDTFGVSVNGVMVNPSESRRNDIFNSFPPELPIMPEPVFMPQFQHAEPKEDIPTLIEYRAIHKQENGYAGYYPFEKLTSEYLTKYMQRKE